MKKLRIMLSLMLLVSVGAWLSASESAVSENEQQVPTPKTAQADTVRMTWEADTYYARDFFFKGEEGATYKVEWGDGQSETVTGKGVETWVGCSHKYSTSGNYTVLLYGVSE